LPWLPRGLPARHNVCIIWGDSVPLCTHGTHTLAAGWNACRGAHGIKFRWFVSPLAAHKPPPLVRGGGAFGGVQ
jgi:hypothetical protein